MTAATIFDGGRRRPFADLFAGSESEAPNRQPAPLAEPQARPVGSGEPRFGEASLADYLQALEQTMTRSERTQIRETLVEVTPREIQTVIEKAAKAKARYLAAVLDLAETGALPEAKQIETLETARLRHEAMQAGVAALTTALRAGQVKIAGVMPEAWPTGDPR
jgi:glycerol-3-phosphate O-acyltransferase